MNEIATKDQERTALAKIRKMVEGLGPQSYLATAFEGCFQDAEENIENDFALSMAQRAADAAERAKDYADRADAYKKQAEDAAAENSRLKAENESVWRKLDEAKKAQSIAEHKAAENAENFASASVAVDRLASEVTRLKAKLYDYMADER